MSIRVAAFNYIFVCICIHIVFIYIQFNTAKTLLSLVSNDYGTQKITIL